MKPIKVKFKKILPNAKIPYHASDGSAGFDLTAANMSYEGRKIKYDIGIAFEIPKGYCGKVYARSSNVKTDLRFANCVGVIDSDYRGTVTMVFDALDAKKIYKIGDRIGQIIFEKVPDVDLQEAEELSETVRGTGGYGSTGTGAVLATKNEKNKPQRKM